MFRRNNRPANTLHRLSTIHERDQTTTKQPTSNVTPPFTVTSPNLCAIFASLKFTEILWCWEFAFIPFYVWTAVSETQKEQRDNGTLRPFKVIETGTNWSPVCDLLVANSNLGHIYCRFRDIATKTPEIAVLPNPVSFEDLPPGNCCMKFVIKEN